ncbi:flavodoxin [Enterococcus sp. AZ109]|uniref:flavodoxin n=1 Tax=Enterococcus sp. AZ109 TaxID=2774634 RepID=UPI003F1F4F62
MKKALLFLGIIGFTFLTACADEPSSESGKSSTTEASNPASSNSNTLIAYFSYYENVGDDQTTDADTSASVLVDNGEPFGATTYVAQTIQEKIGGDLHSIQVEQPYSADFDETRDRNHEEADEAALPALVPSDLDLDTYDTVFIGYPVWATGAPRAIFSFLEQYDLTGKTVIPFCTHDGYGSGSSYSEIFAAADVDSEGEGLALESDDLLNSETEIDQWLADLDLVPATTQASTQNTTPISLTIDGQEVEAVFYDTELAQDIRAQFPLTVGMSNYGGREIYGGMDDFTPENIPAGQTTFENGDITYCEQNNSLAVFYAQTDRPNLSMEVVPIGKVTSNLSLFEDLPDSMEVTFDE